MISADLRSEARMSRIASVRGQSVRDLATLQRWAGVDAVALTVLRPHALRVDVHNAAGWQNLGAPALVERDLADARRSRR